MPALDQYLLELEAAPDEPLTGQAWIVLELAAAATGTCGVTTPEAGLSLTLPVLAAQADWRPLGRGAIPALLADGCQALWHPAWGGPDLPLPDLTAEASLSLALDLALPPLVSLAGASALGAETLPLVLVAPLAGSMASLVLPATAPYGLSGLDRHASAACPLPGAAAAAWACALDDPTTNGATSASVVALLCQGDEELALAANDLAAGASVASVGADVLAGRLRDAVAGALAYAADDGDSWNCALGSLARGQGDCEDGAIALHGLLLAAGIAPDRLVTVFGRVGIDRQGHAWLTYRRQSDGRWVALDWTEGTASVAVTARTPIADLPSYAYADYALTAQAFFTVRQTVADFFTRVAADSLVLPRLSLDGAGSLGVAAACALGGAWLRAGARAGSTAGGRLPAPVLAARAGSSLSALSLPAPVVATRSGHGLVASLAASAVQGLSLGGSARARPNLPQPGLSGLATGHQRASGRAALSRTRLQADALAGGLGIGCGDWSRTHLEARALAGRLARGQAPLAVLLLAAAGAPSGPARLATALPPWSALGLGAPEDSLAVAESWKTFSLEAW